MNTQRFCYPYPRPAVTVDCILVAGNAENRHVLLIERKNDPFKNCWAFPGGFVDNDEDLPKAAQRELAEETGIESVLLQQFRSYGAPGRDPRGHTVSVVYFAICDELVEARAGDDASKAGWFSLNQLPELAFDHGSILQEFLEALEC